MSTTITADTTTVELSEDKLNKAIRALEVLADADSVESSVYLPPEECDELKSIIEVLREDTRDE